MAHRRGDHRPDSWSAIWDNPNDYAGKISIYDDSIFIADAALWLKETQPDLGIENVYELDEEQFNAAVDLMKQLAPNVGEWWALYAKQIQSFANKDSHDRDDVAAAGQPAQGQGQPVESVKPKEGATGWSDTWMVSSKAQNPNCMYLWMNHMASPEAQAVVAEAFGEAPANLKACELTTNTNHCTEQHADDEAFWEDVYYWTTRSRTAVTTVARCARPRRTGKRPGRRSGASTLIDPGRMTTVPVAEPPPREGPGRRLSTFFFRHPRLRLVALLALPVGLDGRHLLRLALRPPAVVGLGHGSRSRARSSTSSRSRTSERIIETPVFRDVAWRTIQMAALVTIADAIIAFPIAYYMARIASPRTRNILVVAVLMPLWASYIVKASAWRTILSDGGIINWAIEPLGMHVRRVLDGRALACLHLPLAAVHDPADLRRAWSGSRARFSRRPPTWVAGRSRRSRA